MGRALTCFAIVHTIVLLRPWFDGDQVVAYVEKEKTQVHGALEQAGFLKVSQNSEVSDGPSYMASEDSAEYIKFEFPRNALRGLTEIFDAIFVKDSKRHKIKPDELFRILREDLRTALVEAERVPK